MEEKQNENIKGNENTLPSFAQMVDEAKKTKEELEKVLRELKEITARNIMGGVTENAPKEIKPQEVSAKEYAKSLLQNKVL